jgi:hypothetical protein
MLGADINHMSWTAAACHAVQLSHSPDAAFTQVGMFGSAVQSGAAFVRFKTGQRGSRTDMTCRQWRMLFSAAHNCGKLLLLGAARLALHDKRQRCLVLFGCTRVCNLILSIVGDHSVRRHAAIPSLLSAAEDAKRNNMQRCWASAVHGS